MQAQEADEVDELVLNDTDEEGEKPQPVQQSEYYCNTHWRETIHSTLNQAMSQFKVTWLMTLWESMAFIIATLL